MTKDLKYFLYLSKIKIDMLWEQISIADRDSISTELKINLGVITAGLKELQYDQNIYEKLKIVIEYLNKKGLIGSIDSSSKFIRGSLPMNWQEIYETRKKESSNKMVLFSGIDETSNKIIILVGSLAHIIGTTTIPICYFHYINPTFWEEVLNEHNSIDKKEISLNLSQIESQVNWKYVENKNSPLKQNFEFIAKKFTSDKNIILGSPIYIAEST